MTSLPSRHDIPQRRRSRRRVWYLYKLPTLIRWMSIEASGPCCLPPGWSPRPKFITAFSFLLPDSVPMDSAVYPRVARVIVRGSRPNLASLIYLGCLVHVDSSSHSSENGELMLLLLLLSNSRVRCGNNGAAWRRLTRQPARCARLGNVHIQHIDHDGSSPDTCSHRL